jgi:hypothetical protein
LLLFGGFFVRNAPKLALSGINGDSAGKTHLMDEESTGGMLILPGIANSPTRNPPKKCLFRRELPAQE